MKNILTYHTNEYFNQNDVYLVDNNLSKIYLTKLELSSNGCWYAVEGLKHKMTSIRCINFLEIENKTVSLLKHPEVIGTLSLDKILFPANLGIVWKQGIRTLPPFWNNINNLKL